MSPAIRSGIATGVAVFIIRLAMLFKGEGLSPGAIGLSAFIGHCVRPGVCGILPQQSVPR